MNTSILLHEITREKAGELAPQTLLVLPVAPSSSTVRTCRSAPISSPTNM